MNFESFKQLDLMSGICGTSSGEGFLTWYHTNLVVSTKQELGFFLFHCLCLSSPSRGAFDQATCVASDAVTWQTGFRFEVWGSGLRISPEEQRSESSATDLMSGHTTLIERLLSPQTVSALSSSINYSALNRKSLPVLWKTQIGSVDIEDVLFAGMLHRVNSKRF